jgi:HEAT repeat protein
MSQGRNDDTDDAPASHARKDKEFAFTSTQATVLVALIAAAGGIAGALVTAYFNRSIEEAKETAAAALARSEFETKLIFRAIEGSASEEERTRNLKFFLKAGFISDPQGKIAQLAPSEFPSKSALDRIVSNLESDDSAQRRAARFDLGVSGAEAIPKITEVLKENRGLSSYNYRQVLGAVEALATMAPHYRCAAYQTNPELRSDVESYAKKEETLNAAVENALLCPPL